LAQSGFIDITELVDQRQISGFNVKIVLLSFLVMLSDGYDLQAVSLAGPGLVQSWHLERAALGPVFSASLFGMLFGGPLFAYVGDRFGRRPAIIWASLLYGFVTLIAAFATSVDELIVLRFITGIGLGGLPANCIALNAEFAPKRVRATLIVLMYLGVTIGSMLPAAVTAILGHGYRWEILFYIGGIAPIVIAAIEFMFLPESIKFLVIHRKSRDRVVKLVHELQPGLAIGGDTQFIIPDEGPKKTGFLVRQLFGGGLAGITLAIWLLYIVNLMVNFFLHSWMPILFRDIGMSVSEMGTATAMYDVGGILGALVASRLLDRIGIVVLAAFFLIACPFVYVIGTPGLSVVMVAAAVFVTGFCIVGIQLGLSATVGLIYPTAIRANGAGWASSIGRFGAILGPMIGAQLLSMQFTVQQLFISPILPLAIGCATALYLARLCSARFQGHRLGDAAVV
jgi:AAHS family 4-hydroxybenzoate transporter-like MFS transporter